MLDLTLDTKLKFNGLNKENPYFEGDSDWNCYLDLAVCADHHGNLTVRHLVESHDMTLSYYETYLAQLLEDGYISIEE